MQLKVPFLFPKDTVFFFLVGCMKSGTTWLMDVLDSHPDVCCQGELHPIESLDSPLTSPPPTLESVAAHAEALHRWWAMPNSAWNEPFRSSGVLAQAHRDLDVDLVRFFSEWTMMRFVMATGRDVPKAIGDKSPSHTRFLPQKIRRFFGPYEPVVLHLVRDPRDVLVSRWFHVRKLQWAGSRDFGHGFRSAADRAACERLMKFPDRPTRKGERFVTNPNFLEDVLREWSDVNETLAASGPQFFGSNYVRVRYEDLRSDLEGSLAVILRTLGVDASPERVRTMRESSDAARKARKTATFRKGVVGGWRRHLSPEELAAIRVLAPLGAALGYDLIDTNFSDRETRAGATTS